MPTFDDVTQPPHYRQQLDYPVPIIERYTVLLKDGETTATIYPIHSPDELPQGLLAFLCDEFNMEIERGDTYPFFDTLHIETFANYWFGSFAAVMVLGDAPALDRSRQWEKECLGTFFVKPNYPGRSSHICNASFLVNAGIRGKGIGTTMTECFLEWAPRLGYTYSVFNLVYETNTAARRIYESLHFKKVGRIRAAGVLKGHENAVDAIIYGRELVQQDGNSGSYRFDKIRYYLETGKYPPMCDRTEKSRLRSSASHYRLVNGKLMLKDREVISDPSRQMQICTEAHMIGHGGINKTTTLVTEKFHWARIKDTVASVIRNCADCRDPSRSANAPKRHPVPTRKHLVPTSKNDEMEAMVAHLQRSHPHDQVDAASLLSGDLSGLDDPSGIIAAVEAAQRSHVSAQQQNASHYTNYNQYQNYKDTRHVQRNGSQEDIPVDPQVAHFDEHVNSGEEIEIARALIQANGSENEGDDSIF